MTESMKQVATKLQEGAPPTGSFKISHLKGTKPVFADSRSASIVSRSKSP
jgi:hypothetical protein